MKCSDSSIKAQKGTLLLRSFLHRLISWWKGRSNKSVRFSLTFTIFPKIMVSVTTNWSKWYNLCDNSVIQLPKKRVEPHDYIRELSQFNRWISEKLLFSSLKTNLQRNECRRVRFLRQLIKRRPRENKLSTRSYHKKKSRQ